MTILRFTLDQAVRDPGLAIVGAGGGLPRRITGAIDYAARVLALGPSGYWPLATWPYTDRSPNARTLSGLAGVPLASGLVGPGMGGDSGQAVQMNNGPNALGAADFYPEHTLTVGQPWSLLLWLAADDALNANGTGAPLGNRNQTSPAGGPGWNIFVTAGYSSHPVILSVGTASLYSQILFSGARQMLSAPGWHPLAITYSGGDTAAAASWKCYVDGVSTPVTFLNGSSLPAGPVGAGSVLSVRAPYNGVTQRLAHFAIWGNRGLTAAEVADLANVPLGRSRFTAALASATVHAVALPGGGLRDVAGARLAHRAYLSSDGGVTRVEVEPGAELLFAAPQKVATLDVEMVHHIGAPLPYIGAANGDGPGLDDDAPTVYVQQPVSARVRPTAKVLGSNRTARVIQAKRPSGVVRG